MRRYIFEQELSLAGGPTNNIQGVSLVGPVIYTYGTQAQKERYLAAIREGREPNSSVGKVLDCYRVLGELELQLHS